MTGHLVTVVAPSFDLRNVAPSSIEAGKQLLERAGYRVRFGEGVLDGGGPGTRGHRRRAAAINASVSDDSDIILCAFGGHNAISTMRWVDVDSLAASRKPVIGYSDCTALVAAVAARGGRGILGPTFVSLCEPELGAVQLQLLQECLAGSTHPWLAPSVFWDDAWHLRTPGVSASQTGRSHPGFSTIHPGRAEGPVTGGNVDVLLAMLDVGVPAPDFTGSVAIVEATDDGGPERFAESLTRLAARSTLPASAALLIGQFGQDWAPDGDHATTLREIVDGVLPAFGGPVVSDLNASHTRPLAAVELGRRLSLDTSREHLLMFEKGTS